MFNKIDNGNKAVLVFEDGSVFWGKASGKSKVVVGEVVFNTAISGYQEILSDPSYAGQIIVFTFPHIGNVGFNKGDFESDSIKAVGVVALEFSEVFSNWRANSSINDALIEYNIPAISGIDTRLITHKIRDGGSQIGCLWTGKDICVETALKKARAGKALLTKNWLPEVTTRKSYIWKEELLKDFYKNSGLCKVKLREEKFKIALWDFGFKYSIARHLNNLGCQVKVFPASTKIDKILEYGIDGIVLSNGPGDPQVYLEVIKEIKVLLAKNLSIPIMGICLGNQLLALAMEYKIQKMKFGQHGANHPLKVNKDLNNCKIKVLISSQNHNYCFISDKKDDVFIHSLFDNSEQGFLKDNILALQGHPEAAPGPNDQLIFFNLFLSMVYKYAKR